MKAVRIDVNNIDNKKKALRLVKEVERKLKSGYYVILEFSGSINSGVVEYVKSIKGSIGYYNTDRNKDKKQLVAYHNFLRQFESVE